MDIQMTINEAYSQGHSDGMLAQERLHELASKVTEPVTAQQVDEAPESGAATTSEPEHSLITVSQLANILGDYVKTVRRYNETRDAMIADLEDLSHALLSYPKTELDVRGILDLCPAGARRWRFACEDKTHLSCTRKP